MPKFSFTWINVKAKAETTIAVTPRAIPVPFGGKMSGKYNYVTGPWESPNKNNYMEIFTK